MKFRAIKFLALGFGLLLFVSESVLAKPPFVGVFSNQQDEFATKSIMLMEDGKGMICGGTACDPIVWKPGTTNGDMVITEPVGDYKKGESFLIHFDSNKRTITILDKKRAENSGPLLFITNEVPNAKVLQEKLRFFDGSQASLEPHGAIFALGVTNHLEDLARLEKVIWAQDVPCKVTGEPKFLMVYLRDFDRIRKIATKEIAHDSLSLRIRSDKDTTDFETWEHGKKIGVEPYRGQGVVNTPMPVSLE